MADTAVNFPARIRAFNNDARIPVIEMRDELRRQSGRIERVIANRSKVTNTTIKICAPFYDVHDSLL